MATNLDLGQTRTGGSVRQPHHDTAQDVRQFTGAGVDIVLGQQHELPPANHLMRQMPAALYRRLRSHIRKAVFAGGEFIYRPDEDVEWIYFPETTAISELQILEDGRTIEVSLTGCESAVGLSALHWPARSINWVQASAPGSASKIKREYLKREVDANAWAAGLFHSAMQAYIRQISQKVACNSHHSVEERLSTWLLMLQDRCSSRRLKLTQEHISRILGVYRPSVTCIAQDLRQRGLIDYVRGDIVILDRDGLKESSCDCYAETFSPPPAALRLADRAEDAVKVM
jgi:CRP-like cAMP-binding protein